MEYYGFRVLENKTKQKHLFPHNPKHYLQPLQVDVSKDKNCLMT